MKRSRLQKGAGGRTARLPLVNFEVGRRYGYSAVDAKLRGRDVVLETVIAGVTFKEANIIANALNRVESGNVDKDAKRALESLKYQDAQLKKGV
jgi:hypothetical protein